MAKDADTTGASPGTVPQDAAQASDETAGAWAKYVDAPGDQPLEIIRHMRGVVHAFYLNKPLLERMREEEAKVRAMGNIAVDNQGFSEALKREKVICIVKDPRFRPPPEPTVVLESGNGEIIGVEVFPFTAQKYANLENVVWLSDGFIMFPTIPADGGESFVMPPVSFPELNPSNGCKDVISCSPAPTSDLMIRKDYGLEDNPKLASVLVAFNTLKPGETAPDRDPEITNVIERENKIFEIVKRARSGSETAYRRHRRLFIFSSSGSRVAERHMS